MVVLEQQPCIRSCNAVLHGQFFVLSNERTTYLSLGTSGKWWKQWLSRGLNLDLWNT